MTKDNQKKACGCEATKTQAGCPCGEVCRCGEVCNCPGCSGHRKQ